MTHLKTYTLINRGVGVATGFDFGHGVAEEFLNVILHRRFEFGGLRGRGIADAAKRTSFGGATNVAKHVTA